MSIPNTDHALQKIKDLEKKGFTHSYRFQNDQLIDTSTGVTFDQEEISICGEYRFEGLTNPSDMSILYALETSDGHKGTLLVAYGAMGDTDLALFMKEVESVETE